MQLERPKTEVCACGKVLKVYVWPVSVDKR